MKELIRYIQKEKQKEYLQIFLILDEISKKEDIISFFYEKRYLMVQIGENDYYRINLTDKEVK